MAKTQADEQPRQERTEQPAMAASIGDLEKQTDVAEQAHESKVKQSMFKSLGILDRFLAVWIFLAMYV
jgi:hypothetical protein